MTTPLFTECPWNLEGQSAVMCYECHKIMLHNPVILPADIQRFAELVRNRGLDEPEKTEDRSKFAGRIKLFQAVIAEGIQAVLGAEDRKGVEPSAAADSAETGIA